MAQVRESIIQKRIWTEKNMLMLASTVDMPVNESQRFIIQRRLGLKGVYPDGARWQIITDTA
jgi:hypothetical protein